MKQFKLNNGVLIPCIAYGTWKIEPGEISEKSVLEAIKQGYTHIDTAAVYGNEESVGKAIKQANCKREDLFITSKVWNDDRGYEKTMQAFKTTMEKLDCEYLDLYLIHWPNPLAYRDHFEHMNNETWRAMEDLYMAGKIKAIGVSNFQIHHLEKLKYRIQPMVNQIEYHLSYTQDELVKYCQTHNIAVEAWSPLGNGKIFACEQLQPFVNKYHKSIAQIALRYIIQKGIIALPKSITPKRIKENIEIFDFVISEEDMHKLDQLKLKIHAAIDPDTARF
ncbi:MAG: aldo/keto reductase [Erysipelotrichia bacterium]|nr:aldo/keto reductase [Erysipelotrichia bacterium]NCC55349.1 aldo/keto reductase [Erysipelotrichia bacterium]